MPKVTIMQDVLAPEYLKVLKFSGYHPSELLKLIPSLLLDIYRQQSPALFEDNLRWDASGDPINFYAIWRIKDGKDARTKVFTKVIVEGQQSKTDLSGSIVVAIRSWVQTDSEYNNPVGRFGIWFYDKVFYRRHRFQYIDEARRNVIRLEDAIKAYFGTLERRREREVT